MAKGVERFDTSIGEVMRDHGFLGGDLNVDRVADSGQFTARGPR